MIKRCSFLLLSLYVLAFASTASAVEGSELLQPDVAFQFSTQLHGTDELSAQWIVAEGYYIYKDKLKFEFEEGSKLQLGTGNYPASTRLDDPAYGDVEIFRNTVVVTYPLIGYSEATKNTILKAKYQGCADVGVCYPPIRKKINIGSLEVVATAASISSTEKITVPVNNAQQTTAPPVVSEQDAIAASLSSNNFFLTLLSFFGFGLLLAFTPCVFPMIPILSGIIIGQGEAISTRKALSLSIAYVLAMASAYTIVGVLAALFGTNLQIWFQNPWVLSSFAAIFVILSLSMFGFYELQMPSSIQSKLNNISNRQESGKLVSAAIMGLLSALIVGPCVTAPLIGALIYIGQTGDALLGGSALFALGLGMGAPLLVIGASAGKLLPRAGMWMETIKAVFGVMMIGVAIWLLDRVLPATVSQLLWAVLLIISGIYLGAFRQHNNETTRWQLLWKGLGFTLLLYGTMMVIGAATGKANLLYPLQSLQAGGGTGLTQSEHKGIAFQTVKGVAGLDKALALAKKNGQTVMLDFYADWCISCKEMEAITFTDASVLSALGDTVSLQADVTDNDEADVELLKRFGIIGPPAILFFDLAGEELKPYRIVGYTAADKFSKHVSNAFR